MLELYRKHDWLHSVRAVLTVGALIVAIASAFLLDQPAKADPITLRAGSRHQVTSPGFTPRPNSGLNRTEPALIFMFTTGAFMLLSLKRRIRF